MKLSSVAPSDKSQIILRSLQNAVSQALDKKKQLGQYAVVWIDGKPAYLGGEDAPVESTETDKHS